MLPLPRVSQLVKAIIRPPRAQYDVLELGPERFEYGSVLHVREDSNFINERGLKLQCSMWRRADLDAPAPCVVYSHGNASCRAEALQILAPVLASGASVFSFDFAGCGQSEGEYISLGWYEKDDLQAAVEQVRANGPAWVTAKVTRVTDDLTASSQRVRTRKEGITAPRPPPAVA